MHCQRGLISYEGLSITEFRLFIARRGLPTITDKKHTRSSLKAQLEQADEDATFDRFLDLPPEIRCQIYEHYFGSLNSPAHRYSPIGPQPPITRTSRQTREEALPLFYSRCCFSLEVQYDGRLNVGSDKFVRNTPTHHFARIQFLDMIFDRTFSPYHKATIHIGINKGECSAQVTHFAPRNPPIIGGHLAYGIDVPAIAMQKIDALLVNEQQPFVKDIAARTDVGRLRKDDIAALVEGARVSVKQGLKLVLQDLGVSQF